MDEIPELEVTEADLDNLLERRLRVYPHLRNVKWVPWVNTCCNLRDDGERKRAALMLNLVWLHINRAREVECRYKPSKTDRKIARKWRRRAKKYAIELKDDAETLDALLKRGFASALSRILEAFASKLAQVEDYERSPGRHGTPQRFVCCAKIAGTIKHLSPKALEATTVARLVSEAIDAYGRGYNINEDTAAENIRKGQKLLETNWWDECWNELNERYPDRHAGDLGVYLFPEEAAEGSHEGTMIRRASRIGGGKARG
jgi:hypothetical protein